MSFRTRLTLFFVLIVIFPMVSVAVVVVRLIDDNETAKVEARLAEGQAAAIGLYRDARARAAVALRRIGSDAFLVRSLREGDRAAARAQAGRLARERGVERVVLRDGRRELVDVGDPDAIAPAQRMVVGSSGRRIGGIEVSDVTARQYARLVLRVGERPAVVRRGNEVLASTLPRGVRAADIPRSGDTELGGKPFKVASFTAPDFGGRRVQVTLLSPAPTANSLAGSYVIAGVVLLAFLVLAFAFAIAVSRALQAQIARFLEAARRLGSGDFSTEVPAEGRDEFAELGGEFNKMSKQLEQRLDELRRERARLQEAVRRIGETVASNLDRDALLELVTQTALEGVSAKGGRALARTEPTLPLENVARAGDLTGLEEALSAAERQALETGAPGEAAAGEVSALSYPLRPSEGREGILGLISVARPGEPFTTGDRELFGYLAAQAATSIENVDLHELVQRQAVTDELTGLSNHRRFQEAMDNELERAKRFGDQLALVMLDIDRFKSVNDTYGHQQGDVVLREVSRVLRESSREIDEPARYGGEELAAALPGTDMEGAYLFAERVRQQLEALRIPLLDGQGTLTVTASFGVATYPGSAGEKASLIAAADGALYRAKHGGRNRTVRAEREPSQPV